MEFGDLVYKKMANETFASCLGKGDFGDKQRAQETLAQCWTNANGKAETIFSRPIYLADFEQLKEKQQELSQLLQLEDE